MGTTLIPAETYCFARWSIVMPHRPHYWISRETLRASSDVPKHEARADRPGTEVFPLQRRSGSSRPADRALDRVPQPDMWREQTYREVQQHAGRDTVFDACNCSRGQT